MEGSVQDNSPLAALLGREGRALMREYRMTGDTDYLSNSIDIARQALENSYTNEQAIYQNDLSSRLRERYEACGNTVDISEAIELAEQSSQTINDPSLRAVVLNNLATFLSDRFELSQDVDDLERGITAANHALILLSESSTSFKAVCRNTLSIIYGYRYTKFGNIEDLETATRMAQYAVDMTAHDDENLAMFQGNLGICYERRFERLGHPPDLEKAVNYARVTVDSASLDNPTERSLYLKNLSNSMGRRYMITDNIQDLEDAIDYGIEAANLIPDHPRWPELLHNVSLLLEDRFLRQGDMADLDEAIRLEEECITFITGLAREDPRILTHKDQLAVLYGTKYDFSDDMSDLTRSMELAQTTLDAAYIDNGPDMAQFKWHMASGLVRRFERLGAVADLDQALVLAQESLTRVAENDHRRIDLLLDLSDLQYAMYRKSGVMSHFELASTLAREAMSIEVPNGCNRPIRLCALSRRLRERHTVTGSQYDIDESIHLAQSAVGLVSAEHPLSAYCLWHRSLAFETRYRSKGSLSDLEKSIHICQEALAATSLGRFDRFEMLYSLSVQLTLRYEQLEALVDLEEAIQLMEESIAHAPGTHFSRVACLKTLSDQLGYLFERNNDMPTLTKAIGVVNEALGDYTSEDTTKSTLLNSLGLRLRSLYGVTGVVSDLEAAISAQRDAVRIIPVEDPERSIILYNLGVNLADLFRQTKEARYLIEASRTGWMAVNAAPESHPNRAMYLNAVGMLLKEYPHLTNNLLVEGQTSADLFTEGLRHENSPPLDRIKAGKNAFYCYAGHEAWNLAYSVARKVVDLFPLLIPRWMSRDDQEHLLKNISRFTSLAASAALQIDEPPASALQILEAGRGVIAGFTIDLKTDISSLEESHPALYQEYTQLRQRILLPSASSFQCATENIPATVAAKGRRKSLMRPQPHRIMTSCPERAEDLKTLAGLENKIRAVPGFEHFLERQSEQDYISLAGSGPIVVFNATEHRSDAIIITSTNITTLRLTKLYLNHLRVHIPKLIGKNQLSKGAPSTRKKRNQELQDTLHWLWETAVLPVLEELHFRTHIHCPDTPSPRVWWVASGYMGLFPMHAAGDGKGKTTMDYVVSSYISTLQALKYSRERQGQRAHEPGVRMLVVSAPEKAGQPDLNTKVEMQLIKDGLMESVSYSILERPTKGEVLQELPSSHLIHFSCHGETNPTDPSRSALALSPTVEKDASSVLTVRDLAGVDHKKAQLAYLSACSTAENTSDTLLDEVIHIASAFQLVGFPHVIGTLWEIGDRAAVEVSRLFYEGLGRRMNAGSDLSKDIACTLHEALQYHRNSKRVKKTNDVLSWAPFIHMGA
ncbi:CHAT domain-containing protein [Aspergillus heterothallicus]